jgi:hypothetical protein
MLILCDLMVQPFERPIREVELFLKLFITTSGGW